MSNEYVPFRPSRREVLEWASAASALFLLSRCGPKKPEPGPPGPATPTFFTDDERNTLSALADAILPKDAETPGATELGVVAFLERTLTAFEVDGTPPIYAHGPFSGRQPFPNPDGTPSDTRPEDDFTQLAPLDRVAMKAWRLYLYGSDGAGGGPNDAVLGKVKGLRDGLREILHDAAAQSPVLLGGAGADLGARSAALAKLPAESRDLLIDLTLQGAFSAPEYGGNVDQKGWQMMFFEGDSMPLGYAQWDETANAYRERPDAPNSTANPGADPFPLDDVGRAFIRQIVNALGGKEFA